MIINKDVLNIIKNLITRSEYEKISTIPTVKDYFFPVNEIGNIINLFKGKNKLFSYSLFPSLYEYAHKEERRIMFNLFFKNTFVKKKYIEEFIKDDELSILLENGILKKEEETFYSLIKITPWDNFNFISTSKFFKEVINRVYIGLDSFFLGEDIKNLNKTCDRGLDICSGSGIQSLILSRLCREVTGFDINPLAVQFATNNAVLNNKDNVKFIVSNLYEKAEGKYDIIVSNTPYGFFPEDMSNWLPGYGGKYGTEIPLKIISGFYEYLNDGGIGVACLSSPVINGRDLLIEQLKELFSEKKVSIKAKVIQYCHTPDLYHFHKKYNIDYFIYYHIFLTKGEKYSIEIADIKGLNRLETSYGLLTQKLMGYYRPYMLKKADLNYRNLLEYGKKENNHEKAKDIFKDIIKKKPDSPEAHLELGKIYVKELLLEKAEEEFENALSLKPDLIEAYFQLGYINISNKNRDKAKNIFQKALEINSNKKDNDMEIEIRKILRNIKYL